MTVHYRKVCQFGFIHEQCRCPAPAVPTVMVCPPETPLAHEAAAAQQAARS